jgi:RNA polymerase sigma factor (sigma-70 family)
LPNAHAIEAQSVTNRKLPASYDLGAMISECIKGSRVAQKELYDKYAPAAYGVIKRYVNGDVSRADEILNESFFKVLTKLEQYSFQGAFEGWIRKIVVNTVLDYVRKEMQQSGYHKEVEAEDARIESDGVERLSYKELLQLVQALPDVQRTVFNLFVFENYSHKEIAKALNLNENNCRWHLNDARRRLKEKINNLTP